MIRLSTKSIIAVIIALPVFILGIVGNLLVMIAVLRKQSLRSTTNYLLVNLAVSDVTCLFFSGMAVIANFFISMNDDTLADFLCMFFFSYNVPLMTSIVSILTLTVLSVERYHAVVKPMEVGIRLKQGSVKYALSVVWFAGILVTLPMYTNTCYKGNAKACRHSLYWDRMDYKIYQLSLIVVSVFISFAVTGFCYFHIVRHLYFKKNNMKFGEHSSIERLRNQRKRHVAKLSLSVTLVFSVFLLPFAILTIIKYFRKIQAYENYYRISAILFFLEAGINPFLYAFQSANFRQEFKDILKCSKCCIPQRSVIRPAILIHSGENIPNRSNRSSRIGTFC